MRVIRQHVLSYGNIFIDVQSIIEIMLCGSIIDLVLAGYRCSYTQRE